MSRKAIYRSKSIYCTIERDTSLFSIYHGFIRTPPYKYCVFDATENNYEHSENLRWIDHIDASLNIRYTRSLAPYPKLYIITLTTTTPGYNFDKLLDTDTHR